MSEEKTKSGPKRTTKISYQRCCICGGMKKEQDVSPSKVCVECIEKINRNKDNSGFWRSNKKNVVVRRK